MTIILPVRSEPNHTASAHASTSRLPYLPGLDGLRAIAIIAVLLYHADLDMFPGGFLGVEVFFVISGYLITALLLAEWTATGRVQLGNFWLRRARRLLPALFVLLAAVLALAALLLPSEVAGLRRDALATAGYVTNWYLIFQQRSYFETVGRPPLLQHLWSLAVEEQFYLIWPIVFALGMRAGRRALLGAALLGAAGSAALMAAQFQPDLDPSRLYYGTDTRATGLLLGAALALAWPPDRPRSQAWPTAAEHSSSLLGLAAIGLLVYWFITVNEFQSFVYQGGLLCVGLTTALAIAAVSRARAGLLARALGCAPLRWVGLRSYSLYLWHWPVFMITRPQLDLELAGLPLLALRLAIAAALAELSYRLIEQPFRQGVLRQAWRRFISAQGARRRQLALRWLTTSAILVALCLLVGRAVVNAQPPEPPAYLADEAPETDAAELQPAAPASQPVSQPLAAPTGQPLAAQAESPTPLLDLGSGFATDMPTIMSEARGPGAAGAEAPSATPTATPAPAVPISAVGDSVMAGAVSQLTAALPQIQIDAQRGRQAAAVIKVLQARRDAGQLGELVVVHTGNNGSFSAAQLDTIMGLLAEVPHVIFVNVKVPRRWEAPNNRVISEGVQRYPQVLLVDWRAATINRPELFWRDGIHLRPKGAELYAELITAAVQQALAQP